MTLERDAKHYGIQLSYEDATGKRRDASPEVLRAVIEARAAAYREDTRVEVRWDQPPFGYETLDDGTLVISAPRTAHPIDRKRWGVFVPLYAVSDRPDVRDLVRWSQLGGDFVATLPLLAPHGDERSPYSPSTRLRWNEAYGDLREVANMIDLYLDFPLGVHPGGEDVRDFPECFAKGVSTGAPPDAFFTKGQNWGFPPLDPDGIRANQFEYIRAAIRHHVSHAAILRLDHVMGLHRLFWIPEGVDAKDGVYVRYRHEELYAILTLESRLHECALVGEDLGTVPQEVRDAMQEHGVRRSFVVQHQASEQGIGEPPRECVASINTHDMPPFAKFWQDADAKIREAITQQLSNPATDILEELLKFLGESPAELVLVNPEDLWGETQPQNVPGVPERSWQQRFRLTLEEALRDPLVQRRLQALQGARLATNGRATIRSSTYGSS